MEKMQAFYPGKPWLDTDGNRIQAHAGYMFYEDGTFYWYGENKEKSQSEWELWHWGVRLYSSKDLYNWKSEGIILEPELENENSSLHFNSQLDRPHILFNKKTGLYVMWAKVMSYGKNQLHYAIILTSKSIKGPFKLVKDRYNPNGFAFGDFELVYDEPNDKAYLIYERPHSELIITPLTDDYMGVEEDNYKSYFQNGHPPFIREAPATFVHNNQIYMITSGTTAKFANPSEVAVANDYMGDWKVLGDPHKNDKKRTSFDSQISCVFKHPQREDLYIAMADRWLVDLPDDLPNMEEVFEGMFDQTKKQIPFDMKAVTKKNTSIADYVWLPIKFEDGMPVIYWHDQWRWEDV